MTSDDNNSDSKEFSVDYILNTLPSNYTSQHNPLSPHHNRRYAIEATSETSSLLIPLSLFSSQASTLQALVVYLHDHIGLSFQEIANQLNRNYKSIWTTYSQTSKKYYISAPPSVISIPLTVFSSRNLSPLESLVNYLKGLEFNYAEIARLLKLDQRTIWTVVQRAQKKITLEDGR